MAKTSDIVERIKRDALAAAEHARAPTSMALQGKNVLLVDDQQLGLGRTRAMLSLLGGDDMELSTARTASAALDICLSHRGQFDIVLLNYMLAPADNGIELFAMLRQAGLPEDAHAVLYSSSMTTRLRKRALAAGFDDTLHADEMDTDKLSAVLEQIAVTRARRITGPR